MCSSAPSTHMYCVRIHLCSNLGPMAIYFPTWASSSYQLLSRSWQLCPSGVALCFLRGYQTSYLNQKMQRYMHRLPFRASCLSMKGVLFMTGKQILLRHDNCWKCIQACTHVCCATVSCVMHQVSHSPAPHLTARNAG